MGKGTLSTRSSVLGFASFIGAGEVCGSGIDDVPIMRRSSDLILCSYLPKCPGEATLRNDVWAKSGLNPRLFNNETWSLKAALAIR